MKRQPWFKRRGSDCIMLDFMTRRLSYFGHFMRRRRLRRGIERISTFEIFMDGIH